MLQVAAPEGGIIFDIGHELTAFQIHSNEFKALLKPRLAHASKYAVQSTDDKGEPIKGKVRWFSSTAKRTEPKSYSNKTERRMLIKEKRNARENQNQAL